MHCVVFHYVEFSVLFRCVVLLLGVELCCVVSLYVVVVFCCVIFSLLYSSSRARHHLASATPPVDMITSKAPTRVRTRGCSLNMA